MDRDRKVKFCVYDIFYCKIAKIKTQKLTLVFSID